MKVIFDTNVLISAFVFGGNSNKTLEYCIEHSEIYISQWIIQELSDKLKSKFKIPQDDLKRIISLIQSEFNIIKPHTKLPDICRDTDDNNVLQLAESIKASFIITGDKDLTILKEYKSVQILTPKSFIFKIKSL